MYISFVLSFSKHELLVAIMQFGGKACFISYISKPRNSTSPCPVQLACRVMKLVKHVLWLLSGYPSLRAPTGYELSGFESICCKVDGYESLPLNNRKGKSNPMKTGMQDWPNRHQRNGPVSVALTSASPKQYYPELLETVCHRATSWNPLTFTRINKRKVYKSLFI